MAATIGATVVVHEDTFAAVYATTPKDEEAIVCILGTGSNCSYFVGKILHQKVQSLGYIAMDDCSGNRFGRHLLRGYYFNKMPKDLAQEFEEEYNVDPDYIKHNLYKESNPNAYLATFAKFIIKRRDLIIFLSNYPRKYYIEKYKLGNFFTKQVKKIVLIGFFVAIQLRKLTFYTDQFGHHFYFV